MPHNLRTIEERKDKAEADAARLASQIDGQDDRSDPFVSAVRATRMPMIITDPRLPDNPAVFINDAFCRMSGYSREEILGRNCRFLQGPETDPATVQQLREAIQGVRSIQLDIRNHRKDGSGFWNRLLMAPVHDAEGNLAYFFASQVDVTLERERLKGLENDNAALLVELTDRLRRQEDAEQQLRELNQNLAAQVEAEVARRLKTEELLRQAQKMEAVGQLTGGLAHDFNNLLTGITGSLELVQKRVGQGRFAELDRYVKTASDAAARAAALTHRLLAFSRRQTLAPIATRVDHLAAGMEELIRRTIGPAIELEFSTRDGMWLTLVDQSQLENSLLNLCINARDAMPDGGKLTVETRSLSLDTVGAATRDLEAGEYVTLAVTDNGSGMTPEIITRAFDPFFTTKPLGEGTGLGLSMIYGFAQQSGGQARIHSTLGQGTTVRLYLPRHLGDEIEAVDPEADAPDLAAGDTILVVDDEPVIRMLIADILEETGCKVLQAETGLAGLRVLQSTTKVDLLLTDVGLPGGMNGRQLADAGRILRPHMKVLFITGYAEAAVLSHGHLDPGMHILTKPFPMDGLYRRIRGVIDGEH